MKTRMCAVHRRLSVSVILCALSLGVLTAGAQTITWTDITSQYDVPAGITMKRGESASPLLRMFVIDVDLNNPALAVRPYLSSVPTGKETVAPFLQRAGALAGVNGGYFSGSTSLSTVVYPGEVLAQNPASLVRTPYTYPVTRSMFALKTGRRPSIDWIYHFGGTLADLYRFDRPLSNAQGAPAAVPTRAEGRRFDSLLVGLGGGPTMLKGGVVDYTYDQEVFFGSGISGDTQNPRTAVGFTADNHVIMIVVDGRQAASVGVTLPELTQIMLGLGCVAAMNLDGGGSTQMAARTSTGYSYVDVPSESREVPTILAAVYADSLNLPPAPTFDRVIDTGDSSLCSIVGTGWFESANTPYWGSTKSLLAPVGTGDRYASFRPNLPARGTYEVHAFWVSSSNRSTATPYIIRHAGGTDTVRANQTQNGSKWNLLGGYVFSGDSTDHVTVSNAAPNGQYINVDAVRFVSYDPGVTSVDEVRSEVPAVLRLEQNYPNPFNPTTEIRYQVSGVSDVKLVVYDILGREVAVLVDGAMPAGTHSVTWDASGLGTGTYVCVLSGNGGTVVRKMLFLR